VSGRRRACASRQALHAEVKSARTGSQRAEVELSEAHSRAVARDRGARVEKVRHTLRAEDGHLVELDVYDGALSGLIVAEVEFDDPWERSRSSRRMVRTRVTATEYKNQCWRCAAGRLRLAVKFVASRI